MKILVFSLGPIFKNIVHGGSQKVLADVSAELGKRGHKITILCPKREDNNKSFAMAKNVQVKPILPLRGTFPNPYGVSPHALTKTTQIILEHINGSDLLYAHDGGLNIDYIKRLVPTVISLRDFCYTETLLGALCFEQAEIIVNSTHTYACLMDSFARVNPCIPGSVKLVLNGYDPEKFKYTPPSKELLDLFDTKIDKQWKLVGFPHRPDMDKGFEESINVLEKVVKADKNVRLLIPEYMDKEISERADTTYNKLQEMIEERGLEKYVIGYKWIDYSLMPEFYSLCDAVLCIGNFCESFSNVSVESLLCGTPVVATNAATYRTMPIRKYLKIVDFGDTDSTVECLLQIFQNGKSPGEINRLQEARAYISSNLGMKSCVDGFEAVFEEALKKRKKCFSPIKEKRLTHASALRLSSWAYHLNGKIYDDYEQDYYADNFDNLFCARSVWKVQELMNEGLSLARITRANEKGILLIDD